MKDFLLSSIKVKDVFKSNIVRRPVDLQGWHSSDPLLVKAVKSSGNFVAVEVGAWKGLSTIALAQAIKDSESTNAGPQRETRTHVGGGA